MKISQAKEAIIGTLHWNACANCKFAGDTLCLVDDDNWQISIDIENCLIYCKSFELYEMELKNE